MNKFLLPVPTHTVGTDFITVQYDRAMIPYIIGLLNATGQWWAFDPETGDVLDGQAYIDTVSNQLVTEVVMSNFVRFNIDPEELIPISGNPLLRPINISPTSNYITHSWQQSGAASGDEYYINIIVPEGSYKVNFRGSKSPNSGIWQFGFTDDTLFNFDMYAAVNTPHQWLGGTQAYLSEGSHTFKLKCNGKNASSTGYYVIVEYIQIERQP